MQGSKCRFTHAGLCTALAGSMGLCMQSESVTHSGLCRLMHVDRHAQLSIGVAWNDENLKALILEENKPNKPTMHSPTKRFMVKWGEGMLAQRHRYEHMFTSTPYKSLQHAIWMTCQLVRMCQILHHAPHQHRANSRCKDKLRTRHKIRTIQNIDTITKAKMGRKIWYPQG
jgi:hypothetical protein